MAAFFWIHGAANSNWATIGNWSGTSGGTSNGAIPSATSDVTFDGAGTHGNDASTINATITILSLTFTSGYTNTLTISSILTIAGNFTDNTAHSWAGGAGITISAASTITSGGKTFPNNINFGGSNTKTLSGDWTIGGTLTIQSSSTTVINSNNINCNGLAIDSATSGTTTIVVTGGTISNSGGLALQNNLTFNGNITIGNFFYNTGTLLYQSGTVTVTPATTLTVAASTTFNTNGITWSSISFTTAAGTATINSLLSVSGTLSIASGIATYTFAGTSGFNVNTFSLLQIAATTVTLQHGNTYTITSSFSASQSRRGNILAFTSDDGVNNAIVTLNNGASCNVLANFSFVDASNGRAIWTFNGTVTSCINIYSFNDAFPPSQIIQSKAIGYY